MRSALCKVGLVAECPVHLRTQSGKTFRCDNPVHGAPQPKKRGDEKDERDQEFSRTGR